jgi:hypothetical protein
VGQIFCNYRTRYIHYEDRNSAGRLFGRNLRLTVAHFVALAFLLLTASQALAEWVEVNFLSKRGMTTYIDPQTIRLHGNLAQMWVLDDFREAQQSRWSAPYRSAKVLQEFDCAERQSRIVSMTRYAETMGRGEVVLSGDGPDGDWMPITSGSINKLLFKMACGETGRLTGFSPSR